MTLQQVMAELEKKGTEPIKRVLMKHGAKEPFFGVRIGDMKVIAKRIKGDQALAHQLYATGNGDAQYLAGIIADGRQFSRRELQTWASKASWRMVSNYTVAWVTAEHPDGFAVALEWIEAKQRHVVMSGWATLAAWVATHPDAELDLKVLQALLARVEREIHAVPDLVREQMNYFVIAVGTYVAPLGDAALATARKIGAIEVDYGDTSCEAPVAAEYIQKARRGAPIAPKRKTVRC